MIQQSSTRRLRPGLLAAIVVVLVLIADQALKIWVKTSFYLGEDFAITSWFHLKFIENNGMAFGLEPTSKIVLTLCRIIAVALIVWALAKVSRLPGIRSGFIVAIALIAAGAAGNIFDCVFYGEVFSNPMPPEIAQFLPVGGGYAPWFEGRVVDMLYFPLFTIEFPEWLPLIGGSSFEFFQYIFNIADASICIGVGLLLCFYSSDLSASYVAFSNSKNKDDKLK